ncbi:hypothetical protein B0H14DRAFT_2354758, partial [Mycena olivaceomarginata]
LPTIIQTAKMHLEHCCASLADLPEPPTGDPATYLLTLITEFCTEIKQYVEGHRTATSLSKAAIRPLETLKWQYVTVRPASPRLSNGTAIPVPNILDDEDEEVSGNQDARNSYKPIYLTDVRDRLNKARGRELPGDIPPAAKLSLITDFQATWAPSTEICMGHVRDSLTETLLQTTEKIFSRYSILKHDFG